MTAVDKLLHSIIVGVVPLLWVSTSSMATVHSLVVDEKTRAVDVMTVVAERCSARTSLLRSVHSLVTVGSMVCIAGVG